MAIRIDANGEHYKRTTNLPSATAFTWMAWFHFISFPTGSPYDPLLIRWDSNDAGLQIIQETVTNWTLGDNGNDNLGSQLSLNTWYHAAWVRESTSVDKLYVNGAIDITCNLADGTTDSLKIGDWSYGTEAMNARVACVKVWSAALDAAQVGAEMRQYVPLYFTGLNGFYPFLSLADDDTDQSANGNNWTLSGTPTVEEGPPIPYRRSRARMGQHYTVPAGGGAGSAGKRNSMRGRRFGMLEAVG